MHMAFAAAAAVAAAAGAYSVAIVRCLASHFISPYTRAPVLIHSRACRRRRRCRWDGVAGVKRVVSVPFDVCVGLVSVCVLGGVVKERG